MLIVIADDDRLVRFSLKSMIYEVQNHNIIKEVKNGIELIELLRNIKPDIAFVDINMPLMDGLTAIQKCKIVSPNTKYFILTGHSEFKYAKRAIGLHVSEYLLKPVSIEQIYQILSEIEKEQTDYKQTQSAYFQLYVIKAYRYWCQSKQFLEQKLPIDMSKENYCMVVFFIDCKMQDVFEQSLLNLIKDLQITENILLTNEVFLTVLSDKIQIEVIFCYTCSDSISTILSYVNRLCNQSLKSNYILSCLYSFEKNLKLIFSQLEYLKQNYFMHYLAMPFCATNLSDIKCLKNQLSARFAENIYIILKDFSNSDEVKYRNTIEKLKKEFNEVPIGIKLNVIVKYIEISTGEKISHDNLKDFYLSIALAQKKMFPTCVPIGSKIAKIQEYIAENYMNDINIGSLSNQFGLTPNYLSTLFHDKTGKCFIEYITEVRICNAKNILSKDKNISVKDLSALIGYTNPRYFTTLFKKITGCYPSDFKKQKY